MVSKYQSFISYEHKKSNIEPIRTNNQKKGVWLSLRELYRTLELPGDNPLRDAQEKLDAAVWNAYLYGLPNGMKNKEPLEFLLQL